MDAMTLSERLSRIARLTGAGRPVVSVYLQTRWGDEHQRDHTRLFLRNELRRAREADAAGSLGAAFDWIEREGEALLTSRPGPDTQGVALFACPAADLREVIPVRVPIQEAFAVADAPLLRPLAAVLDQAPPALVVFADRERARLVPMLPHAAQEAVDLETEVPGHHRRGGWAQLAESRYRRGIAERADRHLDAVADTVGALVDGHGVEWVVLAGEPETVAALRRALPPGVIRRLAGSMTAGRHEPAAALVSRATPVIAEAAAHATHARVDEALDEAGRGRLAAAGLDETVEAVGRGAVLRLYVLRDFRQPGRACADCGGMQPGDAPACRRCGRPTTPVEMGDLMADRVLAAGGSVTPVESHGGLARVGGVAARLRFPL